MEHWSKAKIIFESKILLLFRGTCVKYGEIELFIEDAGFPPNRLWLNQFSVMFFRDEEFFL